MPGWVEPTSDELGQGFEQRYRARGSLGIGGMGEVLLCRDESIGRDVALKKMRAELIRSEDHRRRFLREARVQGQLEHPALVPVYELGVTQSGEFFFSMKRVKGETLDTLIAQCQSGERALSERRVLQIFVTVCQAIDFAHRKGVLHRDLKPSNIMVGDFGEVYVLDWGIARVLALHEDPLKPDTLIDAPSGSTQAETMLGTPGYMSPEQIQAGDTIDGRADIYSLGVILFELLALALPFPPDATLQERLLITLQGQLRSIKTCALTPVAPELEAIVDKCLEKERSNRFATARELAIAIESYLDGARDEERRLELADQYVAEAAEHRAKGNPEQTVAALGKALALNPNHKGALGNLNALFTQLPIEVPPAAQGEWATRAVDRQKALGRTIGIRSLTWMIAMPLAMLHGVSDWTLGLTIIGFLTLTTVTAFITVYQHRVSNVLAVLLMCFSSATLLAFSSLFGPLIMVPALAGTHIMFYAMYLGPRFRPWVVLSGLVPILLPLLLGQFGWWPQMMSFAPDGSLRIQSHLLSGFQQGLTVTFLSLIHVAMIMTPAVLIGRMRDALISAEQRTFTQSWYLSHLLPKETREEMRS